jgi:hypothetical protein
MNIRLKGLLPESLLFPLIIALIVGLVGCIATTNYYTGRTLEKGKAIISPGLDNIIIQSTDEGLSINKNMPFSPSFGFAVGLPYRFEVGLRWYFQKTFEGSFRWQINPRKFRYFDISTNLHYGSFYLQEKYFKYGLTVSKQLNRFEPFISHYWYSSGETNSLSNPDFSDIWETNRVVSTGLAIQIKKGLIIPEINYQYISGHFSDALIFYSIGFRFDLRFK